MDTIRMIPATLACFVAFAGLGAELRLDDDQPLLLPPIGSYQLRILDPTLLELTLVTGRQPSLLRSIPWDFVDERGQCRLPESRSLQVSVGDKTIAVGAVGFKRRVLYAPLKPRDLRIGNYLYLRLGAPVLEGQTVQVTNPDKKLWGASLQFAVQADPLRWSPMIHVNQTGYLPGLPKKGMVGYFLGSLGEWQAAPTLNSAKSPVLSANSTNAAARETSPMFQVLDVQSNHVVLRGALRPRPDQGFPYPCYQHVLEADFSGLKSPGEYRLCVPGLGTSFPFRIDEGSAAAFARTYALGIYHQRCGTSNALPFTRFTHGPCHTAPAEVPDMSSKFGFVNECLTKMTADWKDNPRHTAPPLKDVGASLYPFVNRGPVNVSGGHHDAGDYSKYTINSAAFIHYLVFAADAFPGVSALDNLGLPESGDGLSDVLQEAKWEADFLAKMQDADGGFYFLVYPREREYELDVTPDHGDRQVVFPKTTAVTAAATAALAQCASSPAFKRQFPKAAAQYLEQARKGWAFLERALARFGKDGAYQKITHYGDEFMHDDELAWAACELFLATGDAGYQKKLTEWLNPADPETRRWGWWRVYGFYGCAIRSYAFAARTGRLQREQLNPFLLEQCENEIAAAGEDQLRRAQQSAYGTSFPEETKRTLTAGWYFSLDAAFDLATACQIEYPVKRDPRPQMREAIISNLNYEEGCNPVNVTYLTGLGSKRQREIVHQYSANDRRTLPLTGIPLGNIQAGFGWNFVYDAELDPLSFPADGAKDSPYPFYDRWGDGFNLSQEFVIVNQARALGCLCWLMAQTPLKDQPWKPVAAQITGIPASPGPQIAARLTAPGLDLSGARVVWEASGQEPALGPTLSITPRPGRLEWAEAEAQMSDGRRVFGVWEKPQ